MNKQILLLCLNANYSGWAVNFAATLRANGGNYPIKLITNGNFIKEDERRLFDDIEQMLPEHYTNAEGKFSPGWAKLHLDKYSSADITLYLDIDAVCIDSVAPLFDVGSCGFNTQVESKTKLKEHEWNCQWMPLEEVKKTYELNSDVPLTEINSSYMVWDKNGRAVFERARKNYLPKYRRPLWGNSFPDELAINVALNQIAFDPIGYPAIQFLTEQINRPILGFYGGKNYLPKRHTSKYDLYSRAATMKVLGRFPNYRFDELVKGKHVESKRSVQTKIDHTGIVIKSTLSSIPCDFKPEEAIVIENNQLLRQTDHGEAKNFLNGSICLHNGELLYAYRIEHYDSWWRNSRIALTTLDKNTLQPNGAGYLLEGLTSDKGKHVEDPRLFSDGGKLSMAYTDGYSMYCATDFKKQFKTSKKLLRNSDFIPNHDGREKNWTFIPNRSEMVTNFDTNIQLSSGVTLPEGLRWEFGTIRGGTPLVELPDGNLITFFHSKREFKIPKQFAIYYGGAAVFDANLKVLGYSKKPMFIPPYLDRAIARPSVNINCVFPAGVANIGDNLLISCGENDYRTVVYRISLKKILSLIL
jgi:predicted GH43/DUF377 family glycosyl hydrolase